MELERAEIAARGIGMRWNYCAWNRDAQKLLRTELNRVEITTRKIIQH